MNGRPPPQLCYVALFAIAYLYLCLECLLLAPSFRSARHVGLMFSMPPRHERRTGTSSTKDSLADFRYLSICKTALGKTYTIYSFSSASVTRGSFSSYNYAGLEYHSYQY